MAVKENKLKITLKKSVIGSNPKQRKTVKALGLGKISSSVIQSNNSVIKGMIYIVAHLVEVEEIS